MVTFLGIGTVTALLRATCKVKNTPVVRLELPVTILTSYLAGELLHNFAAKVLIEMQAQTQLTADKGCQLKPHYHYACKHKPMAAHSSMQRVPLG